MARLQAGPLCERQHFAHSFGKPASGYGAGKARDRHVRCRNSSLGRPQQLDEGLASCGIDVPSSRFAQLRLSPRCHRPRNLGMAHLIGRDAFHDAAGLRVARVLRLPQGQQRSEGLAHAPLGSVVSSDDSERAHRTRNRGARTSGTFTVGAAERSRQPSVPDLFADRATSLGDQLRGRMVGAQFSVECPKGDDGRPLQAGRVPPQDSQRMSRGPGPSRRAQSTGPPTATPAELALDGWRSFVGAQVAVGCPAVGKVIAADGLAW